MSDIHPLFILSEDILKKLPQRIIELRQTIGLTQAAVANQLKISKGRYNHYERGIRKLPLALIPQLVEVLGCTEAELLGSSDSKKKPGPISAWEKRISTIKALPKEKQLEIQNVVDALIAQAS